MSKNGRSCIHWASNKNGKKPHELELFTWAQCVTLTHYKSHTGAEVHNKGWTWLQLYSIGTQAPQSLVVTSFLLIFTSPSKIARTPSILAEPQVIMSNSDWKLHTNLPLETANRLKCNCGCFYKWNYWLLTRPYGERRWNCFVIISILNIHDSLDIQGMTCCLIWLSTSNTRFNVPLLIYKAFMRYQKVRQNKEILAFKFHTTNFENVTEG